MLGLAGPVLATILVQVGGRFAAADLAQLLIELVALGLLLAWAILRFRGARGETVLPLTIGAAFVVVAVCAWVMLSVVWWFTAPNRAEVDLRPLAGTITAEGGRLMCSGGDPGRGPDNIEPRFSEVYAVPPSVTAASVLRSARRLGIAGVGHPRLSSTRASLRVSDTSECGGSPTGRAVAVALSLPDDAGSE